MNFVGGQHPMGFRQVMHGGGKERGKERGKEVGKEVGKKEGRGEGAAGGAGAGGRGRQGQCGVGGIKRRAK